MSTEGEPKYENGRILEQKEGYRRLITRSTPIGSDITPHFFEIEQVIDPVSGEWKITSQKDLGVAETPALRVVPFNRGEETNYKPRPENWWTKKR